MSNPDGCDVRRSAAAPAVRGAESHRASLTLAGADGGGICAQPALLTRREG